MEKLIVIPGRLPGINEYINATRANRFKGAQMKRKAQDICEAGILQSGVTMTSRPVVIHYTWYELNQRRDHDNVSGFGHKVIQDALVACGVLSDDGWNEVRGYTDTFKLDKEHPRIEITLEEVEDE